LIEKKRGPDAVKQTDPQRMTEIKRQLNFSKMRVRNQRIIWKFNKDNSPLSFDECGAILLFINWLQINSYIIRRKK